MNIPSERDPTRPRPNPLRPLQCSLGQVGHWCSVGPTVDGQCCQQPTGGCLKQECGQDCIHREQCEIAQQKNSGEVDPHKYRQCIPVRTDWHSRRRLALNLAVLTAGLLLLCLALPQREQIFVPGGLSKSHSQILANTLVQDRCSQCHPSTDQFASSVTQDQLCMNCHTNHMPNAQHGWAHDMKPAQLAKLVAHRQQQPAAQRDSNEAGVAIDHQTRCAECHTEHHGHQSDIQAITDARCQSCHQVRFNSFSDGHPNFRSHLGQSTRRIAFDHRAHSEKYFSQKNSTFDCQSCHVSSPNGERDVSRTVSFEKACASCHQQPLQAAGLDGWVILQLPSLRETDVAQAKEHLGNWPVAARYGLDGQITLPMRLLLIADPTVRQAIELLPNENLNRIKESDPKQIAAMKSLANACRQLLRDSAVRGQQAWQERLQAVATHYLQRIPTASEQQLIQSMLAGLPPDLFSHIEATWFGNKAGLADVTREQIHFRLAATQQSLLDTDDALLSNDQEGQDESVDELLRGSSTQGLNYESSKLQNRSIAVPTPEPKEDPSVSKSSSTNSKSVSKPTAAKRVGAGGWYLDSDLLLLKYMPIDHADPVLAAWIQFAALIETKASTSITAIAQNNSPHGSSSQTGNGWIYGRELVSNCVQCHLLSDYANDDLMTTDWRARSDSSGKPLTKFNHKPHITLAVTADCKHCHQMDTPSPSRLGELPKELGKHVERMVYIQAAQRNLSCDFQAIEKQHCDVCHRAGGASQSCTQCHNYHLHK